MTARAPARRAVDNRPYRLISGLPRTARRAAAKRDAIPCDNHTDAVSIIRHGTAVSTPQETIACPKARQNRRLHRYVDPIAHGGPLHRSALSAFFSSTGRGAFSFWARPKGAPAAPRAVGRGGARERAQFSPQAETELSGLCDDDNGGCIPLDKPPCGSRDPVAAVRRPVSPAQRPLTDPPATAAWTCTAARPGPGTAPRWGWCGAGSPPPPAPGW